MPASDIFAAFRWWVVLMLVGVLATPLTFQILRRLPDRGYAFSKLVGLLVAGYFFWMLGSLGFLHNSAGGILAGILVLFGLSMWSYRRLNSESSGNDSVILWIRAHWRYVLTAELVFTVMFVFWTWVRSQNPAITATEKPMEFAFLNSMGRSPDFPPLDPWLSGFSISYYYFGYVITSLITRLALVPETIGFNLANAWLPAASALGAFGLVYNLISSSRKSIHRSAIIFALVASAALPVAGNLEIVAEVLYANGVGSPELWEWLDIRDINEPINAEVAPRYESSNWWWWRSSRVIHEYDLAGNEEIGLEPIAEFPGFSFILGDLHSHVIALPFAFLSLAVALAWWRDPGEEGVDLKGLLKQRNGAALRRYFKANNGWLLLFTILIVGGLSFLNTWDVLIHMFVVVAAFMAALWLRAGGWSRVILRQGITFAVIIALGSLILYLPFYLGFRSQAGPPFLLPMIMRPTRLTHYLVIFGMSMVGVITLLAALFAGGLKYPSTRLKRGYLWRSFGITSLIIIILVALIALLGFVVASSDEGLPTVLTLADDLDQTLAVRPQDPSLPERLQWSLSTVSTLLPEVLVNRAPYSALVILLAGLMFITIYLGLRLLDRDYDRALENLIEDPPQNESFVTDSATETAGASKVEYLSLSETSSHESEVRPPQITMPNALPFVLLLILTGVLLTLGPEFVYLKDNFGQRINTIFKFYYQAWVLFGVSALFGIDYLLRRFKAVGIAAATVYGLLLVASLLFPYYAIQSRSLEYRGPAVAENQYPATLNGLDYLRKYNVDELEAIEWLRENIVGTPVILEAVGGQYTGFGRVSASTGLPTVLGWAGHEYQWRGSTPEPAQRGSVVELIYDGRDWAQLTTYLNAYDVEYIYMGANERNLYGTRAEELFDQYLDLAYQNNSVKIYRWLPSAQG